MRSDRSVPPGVRGGLHHQRDLADFTFSGKLPLPAFDLRHSARFWQSPSGRMSSGQSETFLFAVRPTTDLCIFQRPRRLEKYMSEDFKISRERMVELLNEDLSREYQAIIAYTIYSQTIKGAAYNNIATELEGHASEELSH